MPIYRKKMGWGFGVVANPNVPTPSAHVWALAAAELPPPPLPTQQPKRRKGQLNLPSYQRGPPSRAAVGGGRGVTKW